MSTLPELTKEEIERYSRHLLLREVGPNGQKKLKNAKVLVVGTGGLGSPVAMYLAAAGVGTIGLVDFDVVDRSNLQRQLIHGTRNVGEPKIQSAKIRLADINPDIEIQCFETRLTSSNAFDIIKNFDIVVDGTDNFPSRYLINDACVLLGKPVIYGSVFRFEGQVSVLATENGACYRCLYPVPPPPGLVQSCAEGGVLGVLPGIIGSMQANETIKIILGIGEPLINRVLLVDALGMSFQELKIHKNPDCPVCGKNPTILHLIDYDVFCGMPATSRNSNPAENDEISVLELKKWIDQGENLQIIDVREPFEFEISKLAGSKLIPLGQVVSRISEIDPSILTIVMCKGGTRSAKAISALKHAGFTGNLFNLTGGITSWTKDIDPSLPNY